MDTNKQTAAAALNKQTAAGLVEEWVLEAQDFEWTDARVLLIQKITEALRQAKNNDDPDVHARLEALSKAFQE